MSISGKNRPLSASVPEESTCRKGKKRFLIFMLPLFLLGAAAAGYRYFLPEPEPELPPKQQIRRDFRKAFNPEESTLERLASLRRSFKSAGNIPPEKRHPVIIEALAESVNRTFDEFARLKPDRKAERAERMREDAERTLKYFRRFPREKRKKALSLLANTPGGRAQLNRAIDTTAQGLSPEDRKMLGPAVKIWKTMLEDIR